MRSQSSQREALAPLPEFDFLLPVSTLEVRPARHAELESLARLAGTAIPGVKASVQYLEKLQSRDAESIFSFLQDGKLIGGCAFLYLNYRGHDALVLDDLNVGRPDVEHLAAASESPEAIYLWAIAGAGRSALGPISARLAAARYRSADIYTRPVTERGRMLFTSLGFEPACSWSANLWIYRRRFDARLLNQAA
jgi:hypothetical protein